MKEATQDYVVGNAKLITLIHLPSHLSPVNPGEQTQR